VFLDSDQLQNLDLLFDIIRTSTKNVVVVLTGELLSRSWCAGEIVTAWKNDIHTVPLLCEGFERLSDEAQKQIPSLWTPHQVAQLASYGIQLDDVNLAYSWLQHELTPLQMARFGPVCGREKVVVELMNVCGLSSRRTTSKTAGHVSRPRILVLSSYMEAEYLSTCEVFQILLQAHLHVECEVVHDFQQIATCKPFAYYLIALLFRGILRDEDFIKLLLYATQTCTSSKRALELVPVVADSNFEVPNVDARWHAGSPLGLQVFQVFRNLCTVLALPFTPLASEGLQERQVAEIASRIHRYQDAWLCPGFLQ
ncbi:Tg, partial [Symbiodinium sp. CCMP2592]